MIAMTQMMLFHCYIWLSLLTLCYSRIDEWLQVGCREQHFPNNCDFENMDLVTVDDYDRCGPAAMTLNARNYFIASAGRSITYKRNKDAFDEIQIIPKMLRDVSVNSMETTVLGLKMDFPIAIAPTSIQKLAHPEGELATLAGASSMRTIFVMSSYATTKIEEIGKHAKGTSLHLWMQTYIFMNRSLTVEIVRKAERSGFKAIVLTADSPMDATVTCDARKKVKFPPGVKTENLHYDGAAGSDEEYAFATFEDITWLKSISWLPIVVKGLLSGDDAVRAIYAGATAILVSNHGGRQVDGAPATIDALPDVVAAVNKLYPRREVYLDSGVRSGHDVYKAIARGAKMVLVGRPILWGLALEGSEGVRKVMTILAQEFNETMLLSGSSNVNEIRKETIIPQVPRTW